MSRTVEKSCAYCHNNFNAPLKEVARGNGRYCSRSCGARVRAQALAEEKKKERVDLTCASCGAVFQRPQSAKRSSRHGVYFCSRSCKDMGQRIGGVEAIQPPHYGTGASSYRAAAIRSHGARCIRCGYSRFIEVLQVHHKDRDRSNASIDNLEVLCPTCHEEDHFLNGDGKWSTGS